MEDISLWREVGRRNLAGGRNSAGDIMRVICLAIIVTQSKLCILNIAGSWGDVPRQPEILEWLDEFEQP
jgi:hypothetical protein